MGGCSRRSRRGCPVGSMALRRRLLLYMICRVRSGVPPVIQRELNTPYTDGLCFVRTVAPKMPKGDDSIFDDPPASTEQILHPDKYLAHEAPRKVDLPDLRPALGPGWQQIGASRSPAVSSTGPGPFHSDTMQQVEAACGSW